MKEHDSPNGTTVFRRDSEYVPPKSWRTWLIGRPLQTADAPHQTIGILVGLAVFSSDAMSSVAYGPQEILTILAAAGMGAFSYSIPIIFAIVGLLTILTISYEQTVHAYPDGGGAYIVSRDNLGELPAQTAGAALLTDYILTVAVSISSGVAQLTSAYPALYDYRVGIAVAMVIFIMVINMRGVKESGVAFAVPTYYFIVMMIICLGVGFARYLTGDLGTVVDPPAMEVLQQTQAVTVFLILKAFANGTTSLTGVEAISNGITAFKEPRTATAGKTLILMSCIMGTLLLGFTFLSHQVMAVPSEAETVISQLGRTVFAGRGFMYIALITSTTVILMMAANTAFADFPRLSAIQARDGYLPRQLTYRGSRLVYSRGIASLALAASLLIVIFHASVTRLIPLYAIGVFLSFTLSQAGMAHRWWKSGHLKPDEELKEAGSTVRHDKNWIFKMVVNGFGAFCTAVVTVIFAVTKFKDGAWVMVIVTPTLVAFFFTIHRHYKSLAKELSLLNYVAPPRIARHRVVITVSGVHRGTLAALRYAQTLSDDITAVHVSIDPDEALKVQQKWETWGEGVRLVVIESQYRLFIEPLLQYIEEIAAKRRPNEIITVVVPQFMPRHWWTNLLHTQTAVSLRLALLFKKDIVVTDVPYQVD